MNKKYYLVEIRLNSDGDFGFTDFGNLNYKTFYTDDPVYAKRCILNHLKTAIDTFYTSRENCKRYKDDLVNIYDYVTKNNYWNEENNYWNELDVDLGNPSVYYLIQPLKRLEDNLLPKE